jgi:transcription termination/antitermination protein NusG
MQPADVTAVAIACPRWYVLRVRGGREARVAEYLGDAGFTSWLPVRTEVTRWSDREKRSERPLFPGYLFAVFDAATQLVDVLRIRDVLGALGQEYRPEPIEEAEISTLRRFIDATPRALPCPYVAGERVRVDKGPLAGIEGVVVRTKDATRLVVRVEILRRAVSAEIDVEDLTGNA